MTFRSPILSLLLLALQAPERASLEGTVTKAGTNDPVPRANVIVTMIQGQLSDVQTVVADDAGKFTVRDLAPGNHRVFAVKDGFQRGEFGQRGTRPGTPLTLAAGETRRGVSVSLTVLGVIAGRVVDADSKPLKNAFVRVSRMTYSFGEPSLNTLQRLQTNDLGEFRFFNLEPGPYYVMALPAYAPQIEGDTYVIPSTTAPDSLGGEPDIRIPAAEAIAQGLVSAAAFSNDSYLTVFYPGTTDQAAALPIDLKPGAVFSSIELRAVKTPTVRVRGRVISSVTGQPDPSFTVGMSMPGYGTDRRSYSTRNADGTFDFRVPAGTYVLSGQKVRQSTQETDFSGRMTIEVGNKDLEGITLSLVPSFSMNGRMTIEGRPTANNDPDYARALISLSGVGGLRPQPDGSFTIPTMRPGEFRFALLRPPPTMYIKSARLGSREVLDVGFTLESSTKESLEIVFSPNAASIGVTAVDENQRPIQGATVLLVSDSARRRRQDLNKNAASNAEGRANFDSLAPGDYKVFAWEDIAAGAWQNPEVLRTYDSRGQIVHLGEGSKESITLRVIR